MFVDDLFDKKTLTENRGGGSPWHSEPEQQQIDANRQSRLNREREPAGSDAIDDRLRAQNDQLAQYAQTGKFWIKQKDTQQHISDEFIGKAAANAAALELLKQQPELKGNIVITAYGPGETPGVSEGMLDNPGEQDSPVAQAIIRRILMQRTDLLAKYGPEKVGQAVDEVADFVGDVDEIGSSDVSGWVRHVEQMLGNMEQDMSEGSEDLELYGLRVGDTVKAVVNGKRVQGDVTDIFPETQQVELLLRGSNAGRTVTVDVRDTESMMEDSALDKIRNKLGADGYISTAADRLRDQELRRQEREQDAEIWRQERERNSQRSQAQSDAAADSMINWERNRQQTDDARTKHEIDVLAHRLKRMQRDDDDWERTFDMMRDRINRYQYSTQRDVDPEQLAAITNIQYQPRRKKSDFVPTNESMTSAVDAKGRTSQQWLDLVNKNYPDAQISQEKGPWGKIYAKMPDGRKLVWMPVKPDFMKKDVAENSPYDFIKPGAMVKFGMWNKPQEHKTGRVVKMADGIVTVNIDGGKTVDLYLANKSLSISPVSADQQGVTEGAQLDELSFKDIQKGANRFAKGATKFTKNVADTGAAVGNAAGALGGAIKQVGKTAIASPVAATYNAAKSGLTKASNVAANTYGDVKKGVQAVGKAGQTVGSDIGAAGTAVGKGLQSVGRGVANVAGGATGALGSVAGGATTGLGRAAARGFNAGVQNVGGDAIDQMQTNIMTPKAADIQKKIAAKQDEIKALQAALAGEQSAAATGGTGGKAGIQTGATALIDPDTERPYEKDKLAAMYGYKEPAAADTTQAAAKPAAPAAQPQGFSAANVMNLPGMSKAPAKPAAPAKTANFAGPGGYGKTTTGIRAPAAPASPALAAPKAPAAPRVTSGGPTPAEKAALDKRIAAAAPAVAEAIAQVERMLESVNSKKSAEIVKAYVDQRFTELGLRNTTECRNIMARVVQESAVRRRQYAKRLAK